LNIKNAIITAIRALGRNKLRSSLTSIGIIIGVSSVIVMIGLGNSAKIIIKNRIYNYGANGLAVKGYEHVKFSIQDISTIKKYFYNIKYITPYLSVHPITKHQNKKMKVRLFAVNNDFFKIKNRSLLDGRFFTNKEVYSIAKVAIIGLSNKRILFGNTNPIGKQIVIDNLPLKVIGVLDQAGESIGGADFDNIVVLPYTTAKIRIFRQNFFTEIYLSAKKDNAVQDVKSSLDKYIRRKFSITNNDENKFFKIKTSQDKLKIANSILGALAILLSGIASISLFVGGVGIMNIMLVSVTERTREIGIRMAIGAKKHDIMMQFLIESVTLSLLGGIIGISLGLGIYYGIIYFVDWPFIFSITSILMSVFFAAGVGIFFGYYPSKKAANLKPIDALKFE
jgi:putative ABC transport system permease protein